MSHGSDTSLQSLDRPSIEEIEEESLLLLVAHNRLNTHINMSTPAAAAGGCVLLPELGAHIHAYARSIVVQKLERL